MNPRFKALSEIQKRQPKPKEKKNSLLLMRLFIKIVMEKMLPKNVWANLKQASKEG